MQCTLYQDPQVSRFQKLGVCGFWCTRSASSRLEIFAGYLSPVQKAGSIAMSVFSSITFQQYVEISNSWVFSMPSVASKTKRTAVDSNAVDWCYGCSNNVSAVVW